MQNCKRFFKQEPVFVIAAVCAVVSMLWVPPSAQYLEYIDLRVLELLFCLMAAVAGMQQEGTFLVLSQRMLAGRKSSRLLTLSLVMLPFFASMLITNDVALITFVPFAVLVLQLTNQMQRLAWVVTLQTIAANIGSMLTPVGNPQNLYLSSFYGMDAATFFAVTVPVVAVSFCLLATFICFFIFAGNMGAIPSVQHFLGNVMEKNTMLCAVASSQVISNVPAAVLLSNFTHDAKGMLLGTNIGGLGTLVASLASLISFKLYACTPQANLLPYLGIFTAANAAMLVLLYLFAAICL